MLPAHAALRPYLLPCATALDTMRMPRILPACCRREDRPCCILADGPAESLQESR